jgi:hypothetical protein
MSGTFVKAVEEGNVMAEVLMYPIKRPQFAPPVYP